MDILRQINWLDLIMLILLAVGLAQGWFLGFIRQVVSLAAIYIGLVLATQYYSTVSGFLLFLAPDAFPMALEVIAFLLLFILAQIVVNFVTSDVYKSGRLPFLGVLDNLVGAVLGLLVVILGLSIGLALLHFATRIEWPVALDLYATLRQGLEQSYLVPLIQEKIPLLYASLLPWLPQGLPAIFTF